MLSFAAAMAGLGPTIRQGAGFLLVLGVFLGSAAWWLALAGATGLARHRLPAGAIGWINRASALILGGFGLVALGLFVRALKP
jgi:putative LysE/RhtB family amino acid efflux pump